ncbi:MAG: LysM peptidoglycan-binding domain-containing protein [Opitutae bacterium]|jgi:LysM repeat protein|nr:LysM peptidoglycan-binding domain-containing protein [Verrucomicrobiota bacterium]MDA0905258.1 LysM peptidoglycan-binding domain-containing protein [Verrucomicrobiota bacterium]MDA1077838.1 LysM peptidoglycan-binding domain-containing protein [Verrucomicrobiota bacterium]NDH00515.1 LysM peptidoglycan-binding domain-containing protein [Opitutae bacterium]
MKLQIFLPWVVSIGFVFQWGCAPVGSIIEEGDDPAFERGRSYLRVGRDAEALDEFLSVTRRVTQAPKSHLEAGRLLLTLSDRKDPVAAIYHFRRFLLLEPDSRESPMVEELIVSAEREIIRKLPGEPYNNYLESIELKDENDRLRREVSDLKARLGSPLVPALPVSVDEVSSEVSAEPVRVAPPEIAKPTIPASYVVQPGDSLYAISKKVYGNASYIDSIYSANRDILKSKNSLKVGQTLRLPPSR